jgi:hypothetical protein
LRWRCLVVLVGC